MSLSPRAGFSWVSHKCVRTATAPTLELFQATPYSITEVIPPHRPAGTGVGVRRRSRVAIGAGDSFGSHWALPGAGRSDTLADRHGAGSV
jgi:hypothetical protein